MSATWGSVVDAGTKSDASQPLVELLAADAGGIITSVVGTTVPVTSPLPENSMTANSSPGVNGRGSGEIRWNWVGDSSWKKSNSNGCIVSASPAASRRCASYASVSPTPDVAEA